MRPEVANWYVRNLQAALEERMGKNTQLSILRSDGGLARPGSAESPVNLLMSGPAGGVRRHLFCSRAGFDNILTFDMGGTSTDVALIQNSRARVRRETIVGDVRVRAPRWTCAPSARRWLHRLRAGTDQGAARGPRIRRRGAGPACYMKGASCPRSATPTWYWAICLGCPAGWRDGDQSRRIGGSCAKLQMPWVLT